MREAKQTGLPPLAAEIDRLRAENVTLHKAIAQIVRVAESHSWQDLKEDTPEFIALDQARAARDLIKE